LLFLIFIIITGKKEEMFLDELKQHPLIFIILFLVFIASSYISTSVLIILDLLFIRIAAVALLLWAITAGPITGVFTFLVIAGLFMERNRRKLSSVKIRMYSDMAMAAAAGEDGLGNDGMHHGPERPSTTLEESEAQKNVLVPPFEEPELGNVWKWSPEDACKEENWSAVAPTINTKQPVRTIAGGSKTWPFFLEKSLAGGLNPATPHS
jgi:hypothetical protein